ncbi:MAG TPA: PIN domain-containing protein, partial [archaeon]|nr:PIN domain-containing protein [archaeon]
MKVLLDTNIVIHRETNNVVNKEIGHLFAWIDRLHYEKCIHTLTMEEIKKHKDPKVVSTFEIKMSSYVLLKTEPPLTQSILSLTQKIDKTLNDINDTRLLNEVLNNRVDFLISEDKFIHEKARLLNIDSKVFTIESFLEKVTSENPDLIDYKTLSVKKEH